MSHPTLHLVDASLYVFRSWHSVPDEFFDVDGAPVNAVYGFTRFLFDFLEQAKPSHLAVAFDESLVSSFRNTLYPEYKANRELPPESLKVQFAYCKQMAAALGCLVLRHDSYEADDLIGSALVFARGHGYRSVIVSADKDFGQLLGEHDEQWDFGKQRWNAHGVKEKLGVHPHQVADYLALTGDAVDNIPGIQGIGPKTAAILLSHFGTLEAIYARIEEIPYLRFRGSGAAYVKLKGSAEAARLWRSLTAIAVDAPIPGQVDGFALGTADQAGAEALFERLRFGPLTRARLRALAG